MAAPYKGELVFWRDLTPYATPLNPPTATSPHVLIIGGGVIGLTNAWALLDHGYRVTIIAKEWASYGKPQRLTSQIAGALWEYPPAVCGQHSDAISLQHSKRWCMTAYHIWDSIASHDSPSKRSGIQMKTATFFSPTPIPQTPRQMSKMLEIQSSGVRGFSHDPALIAHHGVNPSSRAVDAYEHLAPVIDTDTCMTYLLDIVMSKGATCITRTISTDLFASEVSLCNEFRADAIVNCTGLAAALTAGDTSCYPIRGALLRVVNDGSSFEKLHTALSMPDESGDIVFLVPRNDDILLMGGIVEPHVGSLDLSLESPVVQRMRDRCEAFLPGLRKARLDREYPLAQGLRPFRKRNVRVERELRTHGEGEEGVSRIVHSYGHGGAGWSLSFGCAGDVVGLVEEALRGEPARQMEGYEGVKASSSSRSRL